MYEPWFVWALLGICFIGLEMLMPGFVIFFFGLGALFTALLSLLPFFAGVLWLQIVSFIAFSLFSLVFLRKKFSVIFEGTVFKGKSGSYEDDGIGQLADVTETIGALQQGRIRFRGTTWKALSNGPDIPVGQRVRIVSRENVTYLVEVITNKEKN
ncbi:MAG TPA: NfeD family protein [Treponemataceae bacterium]|nr:NfeD family protein [Treponemataceae bacterium]